MLIKRLQRNSEVNFCSLSAEAARELAAARDTTIEECAKHLDKMAERYRSSNMFDALHVILECSKTLRDMAPTISPLDRSL